MQHLFMACSQFCCRPNGFYTMHHANSTASGTSWWDNVAEWLWPGTAVAGQKRKHEQRVHLEIVQGDTVSEARQAFGDWATLITRCNCCTDSCCCEHCCCSC